jgi:peptidoglycan hydrolase-like protein with peptidoglycan-binding domain
MKEEFEFETFGEPPFFFETEGEWEISRSGRIPPRGSAPQRPPVARRPPVRLTVAARPPVGRRPPARPTVPVRPPGAGRRPPVRPTVSARPQVAGSRPPARPTITPRPPVAGRRPPVRPQPRPPFRGPYRYPMSSAVWPGLQEPLAEPLDAVPQDSGQWGRRTPSASAQAPECDEQVRWVQTSLNGILNLNLPVDGIMGVEARSAVRSFQQRQGLPVTGIVGPDTQQALLAAMRSSTGTDGDAAGDQTSAAVGDSAIDAGGDTANDAGGDSGGQAQSANDALEFLSEFEFPQTEFGLGSEFENWQTQLNRGQARARGSCNCHQTHSDFGSSAYGAYNVIPEISAQEGEIFEYESGSSAPPASPRASFRLECPAGCAPFPANQCEAILRRAILDAIALANNAARKLTAAQVDSETKRLFRFFFGHDPSRPVPWANNQESRISVAKRFLSSARELGGGRWTRYRCGCADCDLDTNAITVGVSEVCLCPNFWGASPQHGLSARFFRAGVILHEMLHQLFIEFLLHDPNEHRRNNAHCYEAFAMRLAGHAADQADVRQCRERPV